MPNCGQWATADGTKVLLASCTGSAAQRFVLNAANDLVYSQADKCVEVKDFATYIGAPLQIWSCNGQVHQKWRVA
ncbi:RICIN domain-containing protein [Micromonospora sp. CB01531]|uniref:RICIN domain-containing protein n=1 Tax=Micromonospora sp. CB01531 TaxID=1718947 RepID=UPI0013014A92